MPLCFLNNTDFDYYFSFQSKKLVISNNFRLPHLLSLSPLSLLSGLLLWSCSGFRLLTFSLFFVLDSCSPSCSTAFSPCASLEASLMPSFSLSPALVLHAQFYTIFSLRLHLAPFSPDFSLLFDSNELFELLFVVFNLPEMLLAVSHRFQLLAWAIFYNPQ